MAPSSTNSLQLKPGTTAMTVLLACMTALGPVTMDIYLASMPHIGETLRATTAQVQLTLSFYVVGFAIGQIFYGPLSDSYGRRPMLLGGFAIYLVATTACTFATSIEMLMVARVFQALGASGPIIIARAVVRDLYSGRQAAQQLGLMSAIMGITPIGAPILGGFLQAWFGWQASFIAMGTFGLTMSVLALLFLPETNLKKRGEGVSVTAILRSFSVVGRHRGYQSYLAMLVISYAGVFAFLSSSSHVLQKVFQLNSIEFGFAFAVCSLSYIAGTSSGTRLVSKLRLDGMLKLGSTLMLTAGILLVIGHIILPASFIVMIIPQGLFFLGCGFLTPQVVAAALTPFPDRAGAASSLMGFTQMMSAAAVGALLGLALGSTAWPLVAVMAVSGVMVFSIYHGTAKIRAEWREKDLRA